MRRGWLIMSDSVLKLIIQEAGNNTKLSPQDRFVEDQEKLIEYVQALRAVGYSIVLTQGTFDLVHIGHSRYARRAKEHGDVLIIGVDDDIKARERKGENRPVVPLAERMEMLAHLRYADLVTIKRHDDPKWHLIKLICPDVLIAVEGTYKPEELNSLKPLCGKVVVLERQAETSTSAKVRLLVLDGAETLTRILSEEIPKLVQKLYQQMKGGEV
jgi:D-glycero-beta-D-manno-heptose 1-phosphate adenylyltransferase